MMPFLWQQYAGSAALLLPGVDQEGNRLTVRSSQGVTQGDTLGPLVFSLATVDLGRRLAEWAPSAWIIDNATLVTPVEELWDAWHGVEAYCREGSHGLHLNRHKSRVWFPPGCWPTHHPLLGVVPAAEEEGIMVLGSPICTEGFLASRVEAKVQEARDLAARVSKGAYSHDAYHLWNKCIQPKLTYLLRTVPPGIASEAWRKMSEQTWSLVSARWRGVAEERLGEEPHRAKVQAMLPPQLGGLGIKDLEGTSSAAFLATFWQVLDNLRAIAGQPKARELWVNDLLDRLETFAEGARDPELAQSPVFCLSSGGEALLPGHLHVVYSPGGSTRVDAPGRF